MPEPDLDSAVTELRTSVDAMPRPAPASPAELGLGARQDGSAPSAGSLRILLAEAEDSLGHRLQSGLGQLGFHVDWIHLAADRLSVVLTDPYDAIVLDQALPNAEITDLMEAVRSGPTPTPLMVLIDADALHDPRRDPEWAADDYCIKPIDLTELARRLHALVKRARVRDSECLRHHGLVLDTGARSVTLHGEPMMLSPREFDLLHVLMCNVGRVLSRADLESRLYRWGEAVRSNALEVHIHHLRRKLRPDLIRTVRGRGYLLSR